MADVSVYKRSTQTYFWGGQAIRNGEVRLATDAAVIANSQWWVTLTDAELTTGKKGMHDN